MTTKIDVNRVPKETVFTLKELKKNLKDIITLSAEGDQQQVINDT